MQLEAERDADHVEFRAVSKTYDGRSYSVRELDLAVKKNEFLTFLGPSGSGKTTSLMMLAGFEAPSSGDILIAGKPVTHTAPHKRNIGVVFQNYALFPHMTVTENLAFPLTVRNYSRSDIGQKVDKALDMVRLRNFAERRPAQLSGGQQQRVALARALIFDPVLVLMDEPLGALDKYLREKLQYEIKRIHSELGVTIIYVTHDQSEALTMSDRIAVFDEGRIQQLATPADIYERPASPFVAGFIGENNLIDATVLEGVAGHSVHRSGWGAVLRAQNQGTLPSGTQSLVSVRPEKITLVPQPGTCDTMLQVRLDQYMYHGDHQRVMFKLPDGGTLLCKIDDASRLGTLSVGDDVIVGWKSEDCFAYPAPRVS
ncbi:ABC transporter ATP-binding protein [Bordetella sp. 15P40C-2]|uniref:ABC transporter ATP-binding protein n=1 Tax=Bordetella sp. 15P40C-2 TaxID=2572246 RepID=UPI00132C58CF|nr:ABC transporter ATP-binding protein [Bordetella sp. 15P40C-2]MVW72703.1 polyamine ABC transporter ATP-binding protein [Bordetella sp. 15P40C-2]